MKRFLAIAILAAWSSGSMGQAVATKEFPADASTLSPEELKEKLSGRVYALDWIGATPWRMEFKSNGYVFFNAGNSNGSGTWRTEAGRVCTEIRAFGANCNEIRQSGGQLYYKRLSGEVIEMRAKS